MYYRLSFRKGFVRDFQFFVYFFQTALGNRTFSHRYYFVESVLFCGGNHFLCIAYSYYLFPRTVYATGFQLIPDCVYKPIRQYAQVQVCHRTLIISVINWTQIKVCFQRTKTAFNLTNDVGNIRETFS